MSFKADGVGRGTGYLRTTAAVVRDIFRRFVDGASCQTIAGELNTHAFGGISGGNRRRVQQELVFFSVTYGPRPRLAAGGEYAATHLCLDEPCGDRRGRAQYVLAIVWDDHDAPVLQVFHGRRDQICRMAADA